MKVANAFEVGFGGQGAGIFGTALPAAARQERKLGSPTLSLRSRPFHTPLLIVALLLAGCDPAKRVPAGEHLLKQNRIVVTDKSVSTDELETIVKQKPNKKVLGMRFYLNMFNLADPERMARNKARLDARTDERNEERAARGKDPKTYKRTTGEWLREVVGEPPVIIDAAQTERSTLQIRLYMQKEGWFDAVVSDTVHYKRLPLFGGERKHTFKQAKAEVVYHITPGKPYLVRNIRTVVDDPAIAAIMAREEDRRLVKTGDRFDADALDKERERITSSLRDQGYLYFNKELIRFDADTALAGEVVDLTLRMERSSSKDKGLRGSPEATVYSIDQVTIVTQRTSERGQALSTDTISLEGYELLYGEKVTHKPQALLQSIFIHPGEGFQQSNSDRTYRRLSGLRVFDRVEITYDTTGAERTDLANARIALYPGKEQSLALEGFGTNRGGSLGTSISVGYRHRNLFHNMTSMQVQMTLGFEAQKSITGQDISSTDQTLGRGDNARLFNTLDIGPELTLRFPHFLLPIKRERFARSAAPRTLISTLYNYQRRPDFIRTLAKVSFGYEWQESPTRAFGLFPMEVNVIKIPVRSEGFQEYLEEANDPVLTDSYTDHLITGMRGNFVVNTQLSQRQRNTFYSRFTVEWAGHPLGIPLSVISSSVTDTAGNTYNAVAGIRYAEFVKLDSDLRWLFTLHEKSSMAYRVAAGIGMPYGNLGVLPFESSFFVGGANGVRAWLARSLGPGSYTAPLTTFDRIGEIRIEANAEYRFKLIGFLEGAFFADVGNIWNRTPDPRRPGAEFSSDFLSELAVGTGVGARLNFEFFVVRFDLGLQTKDPSMPKGERWLFQPKDTFEAVSETTGISAVYKPRVNLNLGIGYPF